MPLYPNRFDYGVTAADRGYLAESFPIHLLNNVTALPTAGRLEVQKLRLPITSSVTNILVYVSTAGSVLTSGQCFATLYTAAGAIVAQSADQAANWAGTGVKTAALASGPFVCTAGFYYVALHFNGTTGPTIVRAGSSAAVNAGFSAPNFFTCTADTSITTTSPPTLGVQTAASTPWWVALS